MDFAHGSRDVCIAYCTAPLQCHKLKSIDIIEQTSPWIPTRSSRLHMRDHRLSITCSYIFRRRDKPLEEIIEWQLELPNETPASVHITTKPDKENLQRNV